MPVLPLRCACGALRGELVAEPDRGARGVCHCDDCQAYARWLGRDDLLDEHGGTEVIQTWPARVRLGEAEVLALVKLSPKGLHRWYAGCCRTPVANSLGSAKMPFNGVIRRVIDVDDATVTAIWGPAHGVQGRFAPGGCPPGVDRSASLGVIAGAAGILWRGWRAGAHAPSPWFDAEGRPVREPRVLSAEERRALVG